MPFSSNYCCLKQFCTILMGLKLDLSFQNTYKATNEKNALCLKAAFLVGMHFAASSDSFPVRWSENYTAWRTWAVAGRVSLKKKHLHVSQAASGLYSPYSVSSKKIIHNCPFTADFFKFHKANFSQLGAKIDVQEQENFKSPAYSQARFNVLCFFVLAKKNKREQEEMSLQTSHSKKPTPKSSQNGKKHVFNFFLSGSVCNVKCQLVLL